MPGFDLDKFIKESLEKGYREDSIREALLEVGSSSQEIDDAFKKIKSEAPPRASFIKSSDKRGEMSPLYSIEKKRPFFSKKFLVILIAFFSSLVILAGSFYLYKKLSKTDPITLLPQDTEFYLRVKINPDNQQVKNFKGLLTKFPSYEKLSKEIKERFSVLIEENPVLEYFDFSYFDEFILGSIGSRNSQESPEKASIVLILSNPKLKEIKKINQKLEGLVEEKGNWQMEREKYKGRDILLITEKTPVEERTYFRPEKKEETIAIALIKGHLVLSPTLKGIKKVIDSVDGQESIKSDAVHKKMQKHIKDNYLVFFYGKAGLVETLRTEESSGAEDRTNNFNFLASLISPFSIPFSGSGKIIDKQLAVALAITANKDNLETSTLLLDLRKDPLTPESFFLKDALVKSIPAQIGQQQVFYYSETRNMEKSFKDLEALMEQEQGPQEKEDFDEIIKFIGQNLGVDIKKDILPLFRGNYAFLIASEPSGEKIPIVAIISEIKNEQEAKEALLKIKIPKEMAYPLGHSLRNSALRAKDARVLSDIIQMRTMAELLWADESNYTKIDCNYDSRTALLCDDIKAQVGEKPIIHSSFDQYCIYSELNQSGLYFCADSKGRASKTYINPGTSGYCTKRTFDCPTEKGEAPPSALRTPIETVGFSKDIVKGFEIYSLPLFGEFDLSFFINKDKRLFISLTKEGLVELIRELDNTKQERLEDPGDFSGHFKEIPTTINQLSYTRHYGFVGILKYIARSITKKIYEQKTGMADSYDFRGDSEELYSLVSELIDKGVAPFLKVLQSNSSYTYSLEKGLIVKRGRLMIGDLSKEEMGTAEEFWKNFDKWIDSFQASLTLGSTISPTGQLKSLPTTHYREFPKTERPKVNLFVMSFCPYGNQAEELINPVVELLGDKANIELHYILYSNYATGYPKYCFDRQEKYCSLHGVQELNQDIRELCVQKYQKDKLWDFVTATNKRATFENVDSKWEDIARSIGINVSQIKECQQKEAVALLTHELNLTQQYYDVQNADRHDGRRIIKISASPTLVINGVIYDGQKSVNDYKKGICSAMVSPAPECERKIEIP